MEPTVKEILESKDYENQKAIINREINWSSIEYAVNYSMKPFKKTENEKDRLKYLKRRWLTNMRAQFPGFTKKKASKKEFRQTLVYGEDI